MNTKTKSSLIIRLSLILAVLLFSTDQASAKDKGDWWMEAEDKASTVTNRDGIIDIVAPKGLTLWNTNLMQGNTVIEYEAEKDEIELKLSITKDGKKETLLFNEENENGERVLHVRGDVGGKSVNFKVYIRQNTYHYVFEDGTSSDLERDEDDDDDDDDEDDD